DHLAGRAARVLVLVEVVRAVRRPPGARERDRDVTGPARGDDPEAARPAATLAGALRIAVPARGAGGHARVLREMNDLVVRRAGRRVLDEELLSAEGLVDDRGCGRRGRAARAGRARARRRARAVVGGGRGGEREVGAVVRRVVGAL